MVGLGVPLSFFGRAAQDAVSRAWDHVGYAFRVLSVEHETFEAGVAHAHDLAPYRLHRGVADELARSEPRAVDDNAPSPASSSEGHGAVLDAAPRTRRSIR